MFGIAWEKCFYEFHSKKIAFNENLCLVAPLKVLIELAEAKEAYAHVKGL